MRYLITTLALFLSLFGNAAKYYFSSAGSDGGRGTIVSPWQTIAKFNLLTLVAGDSVFFNRGDSFYGKMIPNGSGRANSPVVVTAYGTGNPPIIHGWLNATSWTNIGKVWTSNAFAVPDGHRVMGVSIGDKLTPFGRTPNRGWYGIEGGSETSLIDNQMAASPLWTGANIIIRKKAWIIDRNIVTGHTSNGGGSQFTFSNDDGAGTGYRVTGGYGYFFANDVKCLDVVNEWAWSKSEKRLRVYSLTQPVVKISAIDTLVHLFGSADYITITGLDFQGSNEVALYSHLAEGVLIENNTFRDHGRDGLNIIGSTGIVIQNNTFKNLWNTGINLGYSNTGSTVVSNTLINIGMKAGMGGSGDNTYQGVRLQGPNALAEYNNLDSIGYHGIFFTNDNNIIVRNNFVNRATALKGDGGGIYTFKGPSGTDATGRKVTNNIVLNSLGPNDGTPNGEDQGMGIYSDGNSGSILFQNNTVAGCVSGLWQNAGNKNEWRGNVCYDNLSGVCFQQDASIDGYVTNLRFVENLVYATLGQTTLKLRSGYATTINSFGTMNGNVIMRPVSNTDHYYRSEQGFSRNTTNTLTKWRAATGYESVTRDAVAGTLASGELFLYNPSSSPIRKNFFGTYVDALTQTRYSGGVTLAPYSSMVLMKAATDDRALFRGTVNSSICGQ